MAPRNAYPPLVIVAAILLTARPSRATTFEPDMPRVMSHLSALSAFTDAPPPAVTRVLYTAQDAAARAYLRGAIRAAGLALEEDAVGNMFATLAGSEPGLGAVGTGSHYDAIPLSGMYDGTVGVVGGLEALRLLRERGVPLRRSVRLVAFTAEEPTRFGVGCLGSRALVGDLGPEALGVLVDGDGVGFEEARRAAGLEGGLDGVELGRGAFDAFVELHIEQGPLLEKAGVDIGIVSAIAGPSSAMVNIEGPGGHAGGVLMRDRKDAVLAGAEVVLALEHVVEKRGTVDTVGTTGVFDVEPGAENSIGRRVRVSIDVRDVDGERRDTVMRAVKQKALVVGKTRRVKVTFEQRSSDEPVTCDAGIVKTVEGVVEQLGFSGMQLVSRAYHDSLLMARKFPVGMIFIPCRDGVSHLPSEFASEEHIRKGIQVLAATLAELAEDAGDAVSKEDL